MRRSLFFTAPSSVVLRDEELPPPGAGQALVQTELSAISAGTEMLVYRGQTPGGMAVDATIGALEGDFAYPLKYGYASVGRVIEVGLDVDPSWLGRAIFAFNPHESHFIAPIESLLPLPEGIDPTAAVFLPNMETAVSLLMDGRPVIGERVAVVGQGVVGLLTTALLAAMPLAGLTAVDPLAERRQWAERLGATALSPEAATIEAAATADLTYELSGNPRGLDLAIALTGDYGRVVIGSWYGAKPVALDLGGRFHRAHMRLIGTQVSNLAPEWRGRWTKERRLDVAWEMIRRHKPQQLITHRLPLAQAAEAYRLLDEQPAQAVQVVLTYS